MQDDKKFQFFLAKLFGDLMVAESDGISFKAFLWRDYMYVVKLSGDIVPTSPKHLNR